MSNFDFEKLDKHFFVTKLAGFEYSKYIQPYTTNKKQNADDIPLIQGKNIKNGLFIKEYDWYIRKDISDSLKRSTLNKKAILIPYVGSIGEVGIFDNYETCHLGSNVAKLELKDDTYNLEYVKYYLQSPLGQLFLLREKQGSMQQNITMQSIRNTLIIKRIMNEQNKIVNILKTLDKKIEINNKINDNLFI
ncbi:restriction endonuclease subunit S [Mycoplasma zalophi]|uniref:restriction endonuclease subunit S n=1 Tax=Mycoplasma zalophi TaxID=191287 RepID=UPI001C0FC307|nr:restriction endonuclease subunit S [Mycoplasma zalophi]MBU4690928.1 restriction endonuclease subunit S [Mycoplasma zalophi]